MARILIVDDDPFLRAMLRQALEKEDHEIAEAGNGDEALDKQRRNPARLVITDLLMPGKEGIATIRELQREFPTVGIIAISGGGLTGKDYLPLARELGITHALSKPFPMQDMLAAVDELLGNGS